MLPNIFGKKFPNIFPKMFLTRIFDTACDRHSNETATPRKHVTKYRNMQKWMVEFLRKFESYGIKIALVKSIIITKSINLL